MSSLEQLEPLSANNIISRREFTTRSSTTGMTIESLDPETITDSVQLNLNWQKRNALVDKLQKTGIDEITNPSQKEW